MSMKMKIGAKVMKPATKATGATRSTPQQTGGAVFKSMVVPIDFSETSIKALDFALGMAGASGSKLHLVHVLEFPAVFNATSNPSYALWDKEAKKLATERLAKLVDKKVGKLITPTFEVRFGRAFKSVCETAKEQKADLIVIGTHGFTGLKHILLGSTVERVVRHAPCSVLTVHGRDSRKKKSVLKPKKILAPTDFSKSAEATLQSAIAIAKQHQAQLYLLNVVPVHYGFSDYSQLEFRSLEAEQRNLGEKQLETLSKSLLAKNVTVKTEVRTGRPATEIVLAAEENDVDLIAISTHGRTGWDHALLGSTAEEVVRHSTCPVLVVRKK